MVQFQKGVSESVLMCLDSYCKALLREEEVVQKQPTVVLMSKIVSSEPICTHQTETASV